MATIDEFNLIPEFVTFLSVPVSVATADAFYVAGEALKNVVERPPPGQEWETILRRPDILALPQVQAAVLNVMRQWAVLPNLPEGAHLYASLATSWVARTPGGAAAIVQADILTSLCTVATAHMGATGQWCLGGGRICSTINLVASQGAALQGQFGAPPNLLAKFTCHYMAVYYTNPAAFFPQAPREALNAIVALRLVELLNQINHQIDMCGDACPLLRSSPRLTAVRATASQRQRPQRQFSCCYSSRKFCKAALLFRRLRSCAPRSCAQCTRVSGSRPRNER